MISTRSLIRCAATVAVCAGLAIGQDAPPAGPGGPGQGMARRLDKMAVVLDLTDAQKTQVKSIFDSSMTQSKPLFTQMHDNRQAIETLVKSGATANFDQQLQALANTQASLTSQLTVIHAKAMAQVWNLLTPDQRTKAEQLHELFMMGGPGGGPGGMMGGRAHHGPPPATN